MPKTRNLRDLIKLIPGYNPQDQAGDCVFDEKAAQRALDFSEECIKHVKGSFAGQPFHEPDWEAAITANLFGWKRPDGTRRYREAFIYIPRGQGKTPYAAKTVATIQFCDNEPGAEIYLAASVAKQADIAFEHLMGMIRQEPELSSRCKIFKGMGHRSIALLSDPASVSRVVSSDGGAAHGWNPHLVIADELHAWDKRDFAEAIQTAFAKKGRKQPLLIWITTADYDRESVCNEKYAYACSVRDNGGDPLKPGYDPAFLPVIYEAIEGKDDWTDEKVWEKANPNLDVTVDREALRRECKRAQEQPSLQGEFKRLHLNIRTTAQHIYIPMERWDKCREDYDEKFLYGRPCHAAFDVSSKQDLTALAFCFPPWRDDSLYRLLCYFWLPEDSIRKHELEDNAPYDTWVRAGLINTCPGAMIDEMQLEAFIIECHRKRFKILSCGFDAWNAQGMGGRLLKVGLKMEDIPQQPTHLNCGTKGLDDLVAQRAIAHDGNKVLRWNLSCTETKEHNGLLKPVKPKFARGKRIDGAVACIMAVGLALAKPTTKSVYDTRGLISV